MASTAATSNGSPAPSATVDELRGVLASKGLKVKDSILARLAKSKSFRGLTPAETLTRVQDAETELASSTQNVENGINTTAHTQDGGVELEKDLEASIAKKPKQDTSDAVTDTSGSSGPSSKNEKHDRSPSLTTSEGVRVLAFADTGLLSNSEEERKQRRFERFGTVSDDEKLKLRAARFGIANDAKEEAEKKRARAARFGIVDEDAKKKARLERFSKDTEQDNEEENEKRKARALRFAPLTEKSAAEAEEK